MKALILAAALALISVSGGVFASESRTTIWLGSNPDIDEAAVMMNRGDFSGGLVRTKRVIEEQDLHIYDLAAAYNNLCVGNLGLKLYRAAIKACNRALRYRPGMWQAFNNRGNAYLGMAKYDKAIANYHRAMQARPDLQLIEFNLYLALDARQRGIPASVTEQEG
ncbi:MAG: tetratricopeptide repeat protein [Alphaproteobacteria bacterium]